MSEANGSGPVDRDVEPFAWYWSEGDCRGGANDGFQRTDPGPPTAFGKRVALYPDYYVDRLRAEIEHWREARRNALAAGDVIKAELDRLRAENEALRADAKRYRWLRDEDNQRFVWWLCELIQTNTPDEFDAAIDEAIQRQGIA